RRRGPSVRYRTLLAKKKNIRPYVVSLTEPGTRTCNACSNGVPRTGHDNLGASHDEETACPSNGVDIGHGARLERQRVHDGRQRRRVESVASAICRVLLLLVRDVHPVRVLRGARLSRPRRSSLATPRCCG